MFIGYQKNYNTAGVQRQQIFRCIFRFCIFFPEREKTYDIVKNLTKWQ